MNNNTEATQQIRNRISDRVNVIWTLEDRCKLMDEAVQQAVTRNASHSIIEELGKANKSVHLALEIARNELDAEWSNLTTI
jgi:hypothetical protein